MTMQNNFRETIRWARIINFFFSGTTTLHTATNGLETKGRRDDAREMVISLPMQN